MPRYPNIPPGRRLTSDLLMSMLPEFVTKDSHEDRAATTTLTADSDLTISLAADAVYHVEMFIHYAAVSAAGFQTDWSVPSDATGNRWVLGAGPTQTSSVDVPGRWGVHTFSTACEYGDRASATNQMGGLEQSVITTSSAGTLALRWAQATSNATATRVAAGSYMRVTRLN